jgi:hypothetical protein
MKELWLLLFLVTIAGRNEAYGNKQPKANRSIRINYCPIVCLYAYLLVCLSAYLLKLICLSAFASVLICLNLSAYLLSPGCLSAYLLTPVCISARILFICLCESTYLLTPVSLYTYPAIPHIQHVLTVVICEASLLSFIILIYLRQSTSWSWTTSLACHPCRNCSIPPSSLFIFVQVQR